MHIALELLPLVTSDNLANSGATAGGLIGGFLGYVLFVAAV